ncbi:restriction endonuclease subunit S [Corynebacterium striatum]|uniref:restriction endonuclease subunit S n=1 Tax=Corynebacterium striatum TaxID=43770 RepID=UPI00069C9AF4|nr:restriction endonuclease subunit S [Corynebacterium striatum]MDK8843991.1 restriction endonuclease subunit S [Corynebacterium striatum]HAT1170608.1 restriction endonuclease subunit S [Corynebacterium striatum]HAT1175700.1 restriction endonuclease subunit S [Corynebacterium striatum]HAT1327943.1 restriction endonuclease subunit S [Corynebacterium striatum]HAT1330686.1 restriction endonuclease subunit S [Corynebacterium striatum]
MASTAKHGWPMVRLGDVCEILNGFAFSSKKFGAEGDMPIIRIRDVVSGTTSTYYSGDWDEKYLIQAGEILVGMDGDFNYARWNSAPALLNQRVCKVSADEQHITDAYLFHVLQFPLRDIWEKTAFVTVKHLSAKRLAEALIPLPPLEEQRRIAAILDEARGQRDKYAGAGTLLGTMTSNWLSLRSQSIPRMKLSELGTFRGGMTPSKKNSEYWGGDVPWFTTKDLKFAEVYESEDRITHRALDETSASLIGEPSIAFSLRGMSLAHRLPMSCIPGEVTVNQDLKAFVPNQSKDRDVLFYLVKLREKELLSKVSSSAHGTKKLDFRHLNELEVPDPSGEFGSEVRRVLEQIRDMQEQIRRRQETSMTLFQALSTRAFQGEL